MLQISEKSKNNRLRRFYLCEDTGVKIKNPTILSENRALKNNNITNKNSLLRITSK